MPTLHHGRGPWPASFLALVRLSLFRKDHPSHPSPPSRFCLHLGVSFVCARALCVCASTSRPSVCCVSLGSPQPTPLPRSFEPRCLANVRAMYLCTQYASFWGAWRKSGIFFYQARRSANSARVRPSPVLAPAVLSLLSSRLAPLSSPSLCLFCFSARDAATYNLDGSRSKKEARDGTRQVCLPG